MRGGDPNPGLLKAVMDAHFLGIMFLLLIKSHRVQNEKPLDAGFNSLPLLDCV